jgi:polyisoprenyl-teichoic acid--peptidoglycan teichoic acid transferase
MEQTKSIKTRSLPPGTVLVLALILFVAAAVLVGVLAYNGARRISASGDPLRFSPASFSSGASPIQEEGGLPPPAAADTLAPSGPDPIPWDGASRVTMLIMGLDYRDWARGEGPARTDTMILLTIDPLTRTAGMLNIPRDLWVNIPGSGYGKINTAYAIGEGSRLPGGGPGLAVKTVEYFLGIPINYYAQVDFSAFEQFIDHLGGIEVDVPEEIKVDPIGPGNTVILQPGKQTLDGPVALAYARARNTEGADFDRGNRQQQVIEAMRDRVLSANLLPSLVSKAPTLYQELRAGVNTNMELDEAISLAWLALQIPQENYKKGVIGPPNQVLFAKSPDGLLDILKPIPSQIRLLRDQIFAPEVFSEVIAEMDVEGRLKAEQANISVLNGSGEGGLAGRTSEFLGSAGANVILTGDAGQFYYNTTVVDYTGNPYTVSYLAKLMNILPGNIRLDYNAESELDLILYLGADWAANNPLP